MVVSVLATIEALRAFDLVLVMTRGGPAYATEVFATLLYREAFDLNEMGIASALAVVMVLVIMGTSRVQTLLLRDA